MFFDRKNKHAKLYNQPRFINNHNQLFKTIQLNEYMITQVCETPQRKGCKILKFKAKKNAMSEIIQREMVYTVASCQSIYFSY